MPVCKKCEKQKVDTSLKSTICKECGKIVYSGHNPQHVMCSTCSTTKNLCEHCGGPL